MNLIIILIGLMCVTVLLTNATPIMMIRDKLGLLEIDHDKYSKFRNRIIELLSCAMCLGFWVGFIGCLFLTNDPIIFKILYASIISIGSESIHKNIRKD